MTLEANYRRLSRLFPPEWRAQHEDALIGTLLDAAEPGRDSVSLAEAVDLVLNPKLTVFFFAFLPQFLDTPPGVLDMRLVGLGAVFMLMTLAVFLVYAWVSAAVRERVLGTPAVVRWVRRSLGTFVIGFAAHLASSDR